MTGKISEKPREDLIALGSHLCDLMRMFLGDPAWAFAHVMQEGKEIDRTSVREASEPLGAIAGNQIAAMFAFPDGIHGYFDSRLSRAVKPDRLGAPPAHERLR